MRLFFTDLDDTLFSSRAKHDAEATLLPEAYLTTGEVISYSSHQQRSLTSLLRAQPGALIPVTARGTEAFARTRVTDHACAVCSNGAVIIDAEGIVDTQWQTLMAAELADYQPMLVGLDAELGPWAERHDVRHWLVAEAGLGHVYFVLKSNRGDHALMADKARELQNNRPDWIGTIHCNGNNLAIMPQPVSKARAVAFLIERYRQQHPQLTTFGVGDSISDWPFMAQCDFSILPGASQLVSTLMPARNIS